MGKDLNENLIYVKVKDVVDISGLSKTIVCKRCKTNKYQTKLVSGNGGQQYEILFSSLEPEIQAKFRGIHPSCNGDMCDKKLPIARISGAELSFHKNSSAPVSLTSKEMTLLESFSLIEKDTTNYVIPEKAKQNALYKVDLIIHWQNFRKNASNKTEADKEFLHLYNNKLYSENLYNNLGKVSIKSLYRWFKDWNDSNKDWKALINNYNYGCESQLISDLTLIEKYLLLKYMLHQNKFVLTKAYEYIMQDLKKLGVEAKSLKSYRHVWNYVLRNHADMVEYSRGGLKAALDKQLPHITKDSSKLNVGDVITGDGHTLDFMVKDPITGKPCRATLVTFQDDASRDIVGYEVMTSENTQSIASALRHAIIYLGKMPKVVHLDNGRAFKGKTFTGEKRIDFTSSGIQGLYAQLGIKTIFSKAYNGRAKLVERFFKELTESMAKKMPSYIGNNIENQPACTKRNEKFHKTIQGNFVPTIEETKILFEEWLNETYRQRQAKNDKTKTIQEYVNAGKGNGVDISLLDDLMLVSKEIKIHKGAIRLFDNYYHNNKLVGLDQKVIARYDMFDLSYIKVYSLKGEFLCTAEREQAIHPYAELLGTPQDIAEYRQKIKAVQKFEKERKQLYQTNLKTLYPAEKIIKARKTEIKQEVKEDEKYKINYAENKNILEDIENKKDYVINLQDMNFEEEKVYEIDFNKVIEQQKQCNI